MITLSNNTKGLALLYQVEEIYGKVYTSESLLEKVLYWGINCIHKVGLTSQPPYCFICEVKNAEDLDF